MSQRTLNEAFVEWMEDIDAEMWRTKDICMWGGVSFKITHPYPRILWEFLTTLVFGRNRTHGFYKVYNIWSQLSNQSVRKDLLSIWQIHLYMSQKFYIRTWREQLKIFKFKIILPAKCVIFLKLFINLQTSTTYLQIKLYFLWRWTYLFLKKGWKLVPSSSFLLNTIT